MRVIFSQIHVNDSQSFVIKFVATNNFNSIQYAQIDVITLAKIRQFVRKSYRTVVSIHQKRVWYFEYFQYVFIGFYTEFDVIVCYVVEQKLTTSKNFVVYTKISVVLQKIAYDTDVQALVQISFKHRKRRPSHLETLDIQCC